MEKKVNALVSEGRDFFASPLARVLGTRSAEALAKLDLHTVGDLLGHIPFRLAHRGELMPIARVREGESVTVLARVLSARIRPMNTRAGFVLNVTVSDGEHELELTFFARTQRPLRYHLQRLSPGRQALFCGTVGIYRGSLQLTHPEYEIPDSPGDVDRQTVAAPIPIYHSAAKVPPWKIKQAVALILPRVTEQTMAEILPQSYIGRFSLPGRAQAIHDLHQPPTDEAWAAALKRMKYEEAFVLQTFLAGRRAQADRLRAPACPPRENGLCSRFQSRLPFRLTADQKQVIAQISADLAQERPMRRLLQGDVGTGKTAVALYAMLRAADAGRQAVLLAPTEVLARQHFEAIGKMLGERRPGVICEAGEELRIDLLTGSMPEKEKKSVLRRIESGTSRLIVGTHALLQDNIRLPFPGLTVIDEQHRFGVDQRAGLAGGAHLLVMTATPIPRTVAMTAFGDLNVSVIKEAPKGRKPIQTVLVPLRNRRWRERMWQRAAEEIAAGGRVFVVCPRIGAGEEEEQSAFASEGDCPPEELFPPSLAAPVPPREPFSVESTFSMLAKMPLFADTGIGILHGKMDSAQKTKAMDDFASGVTPLLVTTTVIEVGVDVPEATVMIVLDAERFGLAQLHQLRGRIGRGSREALCLAVHDAAPQTQAAKRLECFARISDGFLLAAEDLKLRRVGNVLGTEQSGRHSALRFLDVAEDADIILAARRGAEGMSAAEAGNPALRRAVRELESVSDIGYLEKG